MDNEKNTFKLEFLSETEEYFPIKWEFDLKNLNTLEGYINNGTEVLNTENNENNFYKLDFNKDDNIKVLSEILLRLISAAREEKIKYNIVKKYIRLILNNLDKNTERIFINTLSAEIVKKYGEDELKKIKDLYINLKNAKTNPKEEIKNLIVNAHDLVDIEEITELIKKNNLSQDTEFYESILELAFQEKGAALIRSLYDMSNIDWKNKQEYINKLIDLAFINTSSNPSNVFAFLLEKFPEEMMQIDLNKIFSENIGGIINFYGSAIKKENEILKRFFVERLSTKNLVSLNDVLALEQKEDLLYRIISYRNYDEEFNKIYKSDFSSAKAAYRVNKEKIFEYIIKNYNDNIQTLLKELLEEVKVDVVLLNKVISKYKEKNKNLMNKFDIVKDIKKPYEKIREQKEECLKENEEQKEKCLKENEEQKEVLLKLSISKEKIKENEELYKGKKKEIEKLYEEKKKKIEENYKKIQGQDQIEISNREIIYNVIENTNGNSENYEKIKSIKSIKSIKDTVITNLVDGKKRKLYEVTYDAEGNQEIIYYEKDEKTILAIIAIDKNGELKFKLKKNESEKEEATYNSDEIKRILNDNYNSIDYFDYKLSFLSYTPLKDKENIIFKTNCRSIEDIVNIIENSQKEQEKNKTFICDFTIDEHDVQIVVKNNNITIFNTGLNFEYIAAEIKSRISGVEVEQVNIIGQSSENCVEASKLYTVVLAEKYKENFENFEKLSERLNKFQKFIKNTLNETKDKKPNSIEESKKIKKEYNTNIKMLKTVLETNNKLLTDYGKHFKNSSKELEEVKNIILEKSGKKNIDDIIQANKLDSIIILKKEIDELKNNNDKYSKIMDYIVENSGNILENKETNKIEALKKNKILLKIIKNNIQYKNIQLENEKIKKINEILENKENKEMGQVFEDCIKEISNLTSKELEL